MISWPILESKPVFSPREIIHAVFKNILLVIVIWSMFHSTCKKPNLVDWLNMDKIDKRETEADQQYLSFSWHQKFQSNSLQKLKNILNFICIRNIQDNLFSAFENSIDRVTIVHLVIQQKRSSKNKCCWHTKTYQHINKWKTHV